MQTSAAQHAMPTAQPVRQDDQIDRGPLDAIGLEFPRYFTRPGVDPFDEVEWELRSAIIGNEKGQVVFEQRDVEMPRPGPSRPPTSSSPSTSAGRWGRPSASDR